MTHNIREYKDVWVFIEHDNGRIEHVSLELLTKGRQLAKDLGCKICAFTVGDKVEIFSNKLSEYGAEKFYFVENPVLKEYRTEPYRDSLLYLIEKYKPEIILIGATTLGRDIAATLATKLDTGLTADTTALDIDFESDAKNLLMTRPTFGGNLMAVIYCPDNRPQMSTVRPGVFQAIKDPVNIEKIREEFEFFEDKIPKKILERVKTESDKVNLSFYDVIIAGGRGIGKKENIKLLEDLARTLGGTWAVSRKVVQMGWAPYSRQVGQTGQTVHPKIYIAAGISGAIQHLAGMKSSEIIVAINKDPHAPIFDIATYGIVGDAIEILPRLTQFFSDKLKAGGSNEKK
ncbi:electron transfer flavoprotein alpha subunit apoprotein [Thermodesulfobium acidiphilum]|uniref:Electron transfer flavoprotein alpha subunit apoprotein n=1 Tax=Thermodesulfobium acidiphilum TaxID=1794699 RepID=A0A2R4VY61_THEAF|nr:electron transfer flavoprotein subunit alpha/FixB family protein [Thermodesulfobium acidiphilum]AWB09483.1 electron transfer flavoprotein alpha subunit apoprotein [Thermodesulfobium acidiphilum]